MKTYNPPDEYMVFSALLDKGAEVFTKKKFKHSQAKAQEVSVDMGKARQGKIAAMKIGIDGRKNLF